MIVTADGEGICRTKSGIVIDTQVTGNCQLYSVTGITQDNMRELPQVFEEVYGLSGGKPLALIVIDREDNKLFNSIIKNIKRIEVKIEQKVPHGFLYLMKVR